jgi:hypothetical protein
MSYDTHKNWFYRVVGRNLHLWQYVESNSHTDTLAGIRISLPDEYYGKQLIYPDETITNGLRFEGTAFIEPFVSNDPNELNGNDEPTLTNQTTPDEADHVNLTRMLSLATVDYLKAMISDGQGDIQKKEYYMKEFWKKVSDDQSNKRKVFNTYPISPFAVK